MRSIVGNLFYLFMAFGRHTNKLLCVNTCVLYLPVHHWPIQRVFVLSGVGRLVGATTAAAAAAIHVVCTKIKNVWNSDKHSHTLRFSWGKK